MIRGLSSLFIIYSGNLISVTMLPEYLPHGLCRDIFTYRLGNSLAQFLSIPSAYKGVSPPESPGGPETVRGWITPIG